MVNLLLKNKNFNYLLISQFIVGLGDRLTQIGILTFVMLLAKDRGDKMALITFFTLLPYSLFGPICGVLADKLNRKKLMVFIDFLRAIFIFFIPTIWISTGSLAIILFWFFMLGCLGSLFLPAKLSLISNIVEKEQLATANSIISITSLSVTLLGTLIAGFIIKILGIESTFYLNAFGYLLSSLLISRIVYRKKEEEKKELTNPYVLLIDDLKVGLNYVLRHLRLLNLIFLSSIFAVLSGLGYIFILNYSAIVLKENPFGMGVILFAAGSGMFLAGLFLANGKTKINYSRALYLSFLIIGISLFGFWFKPMLSYSLVFLFCAGFGSAFFNIVVDTIFQRLAPEELKGKIFSTKILLTNAIFLISILFGGFLVRNFPVTNLFAILGILSLLISLRIFLYRKLWGYQILRLILKILLRIIFNFKVTGLDNLPKTGKVILAGNHTSVIDGIVVMCAYPRRIYFLAAESLFRAGFWGWCARKLGYIPVKRGRLNKEAIRKAVEILEAGYSIGIFPEGHITEDDKLAEGKEGVALIAKLSKAVVVPFAIEGAYEAWPLPEKFPKPFPIQLRFGKPINTKDYPTQKELTEEIMNQIAKIKLEVEREGYLQVDPNQIIKHLIGV